MLAIFSQLKNNNNRQGSRRGEIMPTITVNSIQSAKECACEVIERQRKGKSILVSIKEQTRLDTQNRWIQKCYQMVSKQSGHTIPTITHSCKYWFGLPILMADRPAMAARWREMLKALTPQERLDAMEEFPVTRLFNVTECSDYIEQLIMEYGEQYELPCKNWKERKVKQ